MALFNGDSFWGRAHIICILGPGFGSCHHGDIFKSEVFLKLDTELMHVPPEWPRAEALFRAQMIAPLIDPLSSSEERTAWRRWVVSRSHTLPNGEERKVGERTLRRWVEQYRKAGFNGLERSKSLQEGVLRKLTPELIARAKELKQADPRRSVPHIIRMIETERGEVLDITASSLWRHLSKAGLGGRSKAAPGGLRRWEAAAANDLWQSDVKHGPHLPDPLRPDTMRKTYLIAFIDDYSRLVTHAEWYFAEDVYALELCFQKALLRKGKPKRVYVDRGSIYQSHVMRTACADLGIRHISATAYHPEGKGKIERFWQNVDSEFLIELEKSPVTTLDELNRRFWAWLEEIYHQRAHSSTGMTPVARFAACAPKPLDAPERLAELFLWRVNRVVDKTGCIRFEGNLYQAEEGLEGRRVEVRFHPLYLDRLQVWTGDRRFADALPIDLTHHHMKTVNPRHKTPEQAPPSLFLETLVRQHEERKQRVVSPLRLSGDAEGGATGV